MIEKKVIIITGASSGIGEAAARLFALEGYRVVLAARRMERLEALAGDIRAMGGEAMAVQTDVGSLESIQTMVQTVIDAYGQIDVLFNNAGFGRTKWLEELDPVRDVAAQINVNVLGVIQTTRAALPHMIQRGSGHVINMASMAAFVASPTYSVYAASKFAVRGFTDALRREVGVCGIRVSGIYPGVVATEFGEKTGVDRKTNITTPRLLLLSAEEVAEAAFKLTRRPRRTVILPWVMRILFWVDRLFPGLSDWIIERTFTRRERGL